MGLVSQHVHISRNIWSGSINEAEAASATLTTTLATSPATTAPGPSCGILRIREQRHHAAATFGDANDPATADAGTLSEAKIEKDAYVNTISEGPCQCSDSDDGNITGRCCNQRGSPPSLSAETVATLAFESEAITPQFLNLAARESFEFSWDLWVRLSPTRRGLSPPLLLRSRCSTS